MGKENTGTKRFLAEEVWAVRNVEVFLTLFDNYIFLRHIRCMDKRRNEKTKQKPTSFKLPRSKILSNETNHVNLAELIYLW